MNCSFLRRNWIGITGVFAGIIGIALSIYFYTVSRSFREPVFLEDPIRTEIVTRERITQAPIKVFRANGDEVTSDLISLRFYFWNAGNEPIHSNDVLRDVTIYLDNEETEILDFLFLKTSRDVTQLALRRDPSEPLRSLILSFSILERNDGGTGQIVYEGPQDSKLKIKGVIEGVKDFTLTSDLQSSRFWYEYGKKVIIFPLVIACMILIAITGHLLERVSERGRFIWNRQFVRVLVRVFFGGVLVFMLFGFIMGVIVDPISKAKEDAQKSVVQNAPSQILPLE